MIHHYVQPGDTVSGIARLHGTTIPAIAAANRQIIDINLIRAGDVLHVPVIVTDPPVADPPVEEPPVEEPPVEEPPAEEPPVEEPPAEEPPAEEPPVAGGHLWASITKTTPSSDLLAVASSNWGTASISNQDSNHDVYTFAGSLVARATGDLVTAGKVVRAIEAAIGTEAGGRTLALARNLTGYVLAADYVGYRGQAFVDWVDRVRTANLDGRTLVSTHEDRPNNWGTHAGTARIAAALYLGDTDDLDRAATVFRGFLGDREAYAGFKYGDLSWQVDPSKPVGINPIGARIDGHDVDGVIPDDQRRSGTFQWPAPKGSYPWEAMQGIVTTAALLARNGYPGVWTWEDFAIVRAWEWLIQVNNNPPTGDDRFLVPLVDWMYGGKYQGGPVGHGKSIGWTDWTHGDA